MSKRVGEGEGLCVRQGPRPLTELRGRAVALGEALGRGEPSRRGRHDVRGEGRRRRGGSSSCGGRSVATWNTESRMRAGRSPQPHPPVSHPVLSISSQQGLTDRLSCWHPHPCRENREGWVLRQRHGVDWGPPPPAGPGVLTHHGCRGDVRGEPSLGRMAPALPSSPSVGRAGTPTEQGLSRMCGTQAGRQEARAASGQALVLPLLVGVRASGLTRWSPTAVACFAIKTILKASPGETRNKAWSHAETVYELGGARCPSLDSVPSLGF